MLVADIHHLDGAVNARLLVDGIDFFLRDVVRGSGFLVLRETDRGAQDQGDTHNSQNGCLHQAPPQENNKN